MLWVDIEALGVLKPEVGIPRLSSVKLSMKFYKLQKTAFDRKQLNNFVMAFCP